MRIIRRIISFFIIIASSIGLIFSLYLSFRLLTIRSEIVQQINNGMNLVIDLSSSAADGIDVMDDTLQNASASLDTLQSSTSITAESMMAASDMVESFDTLFSEDLPLTIENTQVSIASAEDSAGAIDKLLKALSSIPFVNLDYNPEVPLSEALGNVGKSLEGMPSLFEEIGSSMGITNSNILDLNFQMTEMSDNLDLVNGNLEDARSVLKDTSTNLETLIEKLDQIQQNLPKYLFWITLTGVVFMLSTVAILLSTLLHGLDLLKTGDLKE